jgi:hypothetical protein
MRKGEDELSMMPAMRPRTTAWLQATFLRHLARSGSQAEAAARCGVTARSVRRWCANDSRFADRYERVMSQRRKFLAEQGTASGGRSIFRRHRFTSAERCNDMLLMRLLSQADRIREGAARRESPLLAEIRTHRRQVDRSMNSRTCTPGSATRTERDRESRSVACLVGLRTRLAT